jgi:uncharacterized membrane protein YvlD (DUF360 family)
MPRFLLGWILSLAANALALVLAWVLIPGFKLTSVWGFILAVVIFGILNAIAVWTVSKSLRGRADRLMPAVGIISTFLALLITSLLNTGLEIDGLSTWIVATVLIWLVSMIIWVIPGPWRSASRPRTKKG